MMMRKHAADGVRDSKRDAAGFLPLAAGLSHMKTSDDRRSYPSPLWGLRRASLAHGWLAQILYLGQSGGGSHNGSRACDYPTPAYGRPSPQGGAIRKRWGGSAFHLRWTWDIG